MNNAIRLFAITVAVMIGASAPLGAAEKHSKDECSGTIRKGEMTCEEAVGYFLNVVDPALRRAVQDPRTPAGISNRLRSLYRELVKNETFIQPLSHYIDYGQASHRLAFRAFDETGSKTVIVISMPQIRDDLAKNESFDFAAAIVVAHERGHQEEQGLTAPEDLPKFEAVVSAITVKEMIRPLLGQVALPKFLTQLSEKFAEFGDNPQDPRWVELFSPKVAGKEIASAK